MTNTVDNQQSRRLNGFAPKYFFGNVVNNFPTQVVLNPVGRKKFEFIVILQQD